MNLLFVWGSEAPLIPKVGEILIIFFPHNCGLGGLFILLIGYAKLFYWAHKAVNI